MTIPLSRPAFLRGKFSQFSLSAFLTAVKHRQRRVLARQFGVILENFYKFKKS